MPGWVAEWFKAHAWKVCLGQKPNVGSNPTPSVNPVALARDGVARLETAQAAKRRRIGGARQCVCTHHHCAHPALLRHVHDRSLRCARHERYAIPRRRKSHHDIWENLVGRSDGFWQHFYPQLQSVFHESLHDISRETFRRVVNHVAPGIIRVQADEVTYDLHILIRFELERALLSGDLRAGELPAAWAEMNQPYLRGHPNMNRP